jgi:hypothetical protein
MPQAETSIFSLVLFVPLIHFVPSNPSVLHVTYVPCYSPYTKNTTQTSVPPLGFEPTIPASELPHALDRAATGTNTNSMQVKVIG